MTKQDIKNIDHTAYKVPYNSELTIPYRSPSKLNSMIDYLFRHTSLPKINRTLYNNVSTSGSKQLLNDMGIVAIAMCKYYVDNQQQFNYSLENIQMQILIRMWKQTFKHCTYQSVELEEYIPTKQKTLAIENGFWDELLRVVKDEDYIATNDSMVKVRKNVGLRDRRKGISKKHMDYLLRFG